MAVARFTRDRVRLGEFCFSPDWLTRAQSQLRFGNPLGWQAAEMEVEFMAHCQVRTAR